MYNCYYFLLLTIFIKIFIKLNMYKYFNKVNFILDIYITWSYVGTYNVLFF